MLFIVRSESEDVISEREKEVVFKDREVAKKNALKLNPLSDQ